MSKTTHPAFRRTARWSLLLLSGVALGVVLGFALALAKPRVKE